MMRNSNRFRHNYDLCEKLNYVQLIFCRRANNKCHCISERGRSAMLAGLSAWNTGILCIV
jgi:hypothetical protein